MGKRFRRIPKDPSNQKRSIESLRKQTPSETVVAQVMLQGREALELADSSQQIALTRIQKLCKDHCKIPLLFRIQAEILEKCYANAVSSLKRRKYLEEAKRCITIGYEVSDKKNMVFLSYLGSLMMIEGASDSQCCRDAIDTLNEAYLISDPTDPIASVILSEDETQAFTGFFPSYEDRVESAKNNIVNALGFCVLNLRRLGASLSSIRQILQNLGVKKADKVKLYWICLSAQEKHCFLQVKELTSYLISLEQYSANQLLSQAISFYEAHAKWNFWMCCCCSRTFPTSQLHFLHVTTTHLNELSSHLKTVFPALTLNASDWPLVIKTMTWKPVSSSAAIPMLQEKWKSAQNRRPKIGNNTVVSPESSSNSGEVQSVEDSTFELLRCGVNPWAKTEVFKWKWPFVNDSKRGTPLNHILKSLKKLLSEKIFLAAHMNILIQRAVSMLDGSLGGLIRDLGLDQTHYPLCLLKASQLHKILNLVQEMSAFTTKCFEQQSSVVETLDCSMNAFNIDRAISLSRESLYLVLDEKAFQTEPTSGNSPTKDDDASIPPWVQGMVSWIYSDHSSDESPEKWRTLKDERRCRAEQELVTYKQLFTERLTKVLYCQEGLSGKVPPTDVLPPNLRKYMGSASQKPQVDSFTEPVIQKGSENNDSELTEIDKLTLQTATDMRQMETKLNYFAAYDYQPIVLSIVKTYLREYAEGTVDTTKKSDGAAAHQNVADCGTEGPEDGIRKRNTKALLQSQVSRKRRRKSRSHQPVREIPDATARWCLDSGAGISCTGKLSLLGDLVRPPLPPELQFFRLPNGSEGHAEIAGTLMIYTSVGLLRAIHERFSAPDRSYVLKDVVFQEGLRSNVISVMQFTKQNNCSVEMYGKYYLIRDLRDRKGNSFPNKNEIVLLDPSRYGNYYYIDRPPPSAAVKGTVDTTKKSDDAAGITVPDMNNTEDGP